MVKNPTSNRRRTPGKGTLTLLAVTAVLTGLALWVGISDNPPGIVLLYGAGVSLVLSGTHRWRSPKRFGFLLGASGVGFVLNVLIHNFSEVGAERITHLPVLAALLTAVSVVSFLLAIIVCPMGGLVGTIGGIATLVTGRDRTV
jgi:hypothetical protein